MTKIKAQLKEEMRVEIEQENNKKWEEIHAYLALDFCPPPETFNSGSFSPLYLFRNFNLFEKKLYGIHFDIVFVYGIHFNIFIV